MRGRLASEADQNSILRAVALEAITCRTAKSLLDSVNLPTQLRNNLGVIRRTLLHFEIFGDIRKPRSKLRKCRWSALPQFIKLALLDFVADHPALYVDEISLHFSRLTGFKISPTMGSL